MPDTITIRLSKQLQKELGVLTKAEKTTKSKIIREAIQRLIALKRFQQLRKQVLPFAEAEGLLTDEDIYKALS